MYLLCYPEIDNLHVNVNLYIAASYLSDNKLFTECIDDCMCGFCRYQPGQPQGLVRTRGRNRKPGQPQGLVCTRGRNAVNR
jgi:hypothetical protein